jgi:CMP-N-acetylneuraminic acid synthetase
MKFFVIIKEKSERLKNKNFLLLNNLKLYEHLLIELKGQEVFVDTDSDEIFDDLSETEIFCYKRKKEFIDLEKNQGFGISPVLLMVENFLDCYVTDDNEIIVTPHVTSPFVKLSTILDASKMLNHGYDSVLACTEHQEFSYFNGKPVNFDPDVVQKTQDLEPIVMGNGAFFIFTKKMFKKYKNRTGKRPYFYPLKFPESIEIDNKEDFDLAKAVAYDE